MAQDIYHSRKKKDNVVIVGTGMIASALESLSGWDDDVIFSAGVSNSGEKDESKFRREIELVRENLKKISPSSTFVYFSTTSIFDLSKKDNPYILHKLFIENLIRASRLNFLILRLPNLVGSSPNPNTLTNYFADSIKQGREITLNQSAVRHLIDVADLSTILNEIKEKYGKNKLSVNINTDKPLTAGQILSTLESVLNKKARVILLPGDSIKKPDEEFDTSAFNYIWKTNEDYHSKLLKKYYSI